MELQYKSFYFIRHGETDLNRSKLINGSIDVSLNALGTEQAIKAAKILSTQNFSAIISSPRLRAFETAQWIAKDTNKSIIINEGLVERVWGSAEGKPYGLTISMTDDANTPHGAELFSVFQQRVLKTMSLILAEHDLPLIVSHGGVFKALVHALGYGELGSNNAELFLFKAPSSKEKSWLIINLNQEIIQC